MFTMVCSRGRTTRAGRSQTHNPKVAGSNPAPATMNDEGLADAEAASPFRLPRLHPGIGMSAWLRRAAGKRRPRRYLADIPHQRQTPREDGHERSESVDPGIADAAGARRRDHHGRPAE